MQNYDLSEARREFLSAKNFQMEGDSGKARVCARRSVGLALLSYYQFKGKPQASRNAFNLIQAFQAEEGLPDGIRTAAEILTMRVGVDFTLPPGVEPLASAEFIISWIESIINGG